MTFFGPDIRNGLPIGLGSMAGFGRRAFTPSVLFAAGEQGFWYDPSDIPVNWRRNLLTYTEQFDNAAWVKAASTVTISSNATTSPIGDSTADKLISVNTTGQLRLSFDDQATFPADLYTLSVYAKAAEWNFCGVTLYDGTNYFGAIFNLTTGAASFVQSGTTTTATSVGNGWWRVTVTARTTGNLSQAAKVSGFWPRSALPTINIQQASTGDGTSGIFIWGAQLERASTATDYQRIVTSEISFLEYQPTPVMYTDSAGTTPVTAVEQAVGLILDKSKGLVLGPELVTNGDFSSATGWTVGAGWAITGGVAEATSASSNLLQTNVAPSPQGKTYRVQLTILTRSTGSIIPQISGAQASLSAPGTYVFYLTPTSTDATLYIPGVNFTGTIDNVSVRQIFGNHAIQPGATNRPILRSRYNLLLNTDFAGAAAGTPGTAPTLWSLLLSTGAITAVNGNQLSFSASTTRIVLGQSVSYAANSTYRARITVHANSGVTANQLFAWNQAISGTSESFFANGVSETTTTYVPVPGDVLEWRLAIGATAGSSTIRFGLGCGSNVTGTATTSQPDIRLLVDNYLPAYQRVTSATDYDTVGFPVYLAFDGSDDSLYTGGSIDFSATDKMTVWAGVTKLSDAAGGMIHEHGASGSGTFYLYAPGSADYQWRSGGTLNSNVNSTTFAAPITNVVTGIGDISGDVSTIRVDGAQSNTGSADQGTGNYANAVLNIGRRNNSSLPFNGRIYSLIGRGAATSAALITQAERWVAGKQGRAL